MCRDASDGDSRGMSLGLSFGDPFQVLPHPHYHPLCPLSQAAPGLSVQWGAQLPLASQIAETAMHGDFSCK